MRDIKVTSVANCWGGLLRGLLVSLVAVLSAICQSAWAETPDRKPFEADLLRYRSYFDYGGFEPDLRTLLPEGYVSRWRLSAGVDGEYSDNVDKDAQRQEAFSSNGSLGIGWTRHSPRLRGNADYRFSTPIYQSEEIDDRTASTHALAATAEWQAAPHLEFDLGGHVTQNLERGLSTPVLGVRSNYGNRSDEYAARGGYSWRLSRTVTNQSSYAFSYRNYVADRAEGDDTRSHRAGTALGWQATAKDNLSFGYRYAFEDQVNASFERQNHIGSATWGHTFLTFPGNRRSDLSISYTADRGLVDGGADYWNHAGTVGYALALSPRTDAGVHAGYQWIRPEEGSTEQGVIYGGNLTHRFTEHTSGTLLFGEAWSYEPATTSNDFTELTRTRQVQGNLVSRLSRSVTGRLSAGYLRGDVEQQLSQEESGNYWVARGTAAVSVRVVGDRGFGGLRYSVYRRQTEDSDEDFLLHTWNLYYRRPLWNWLSGIVRYSHERRNYDVSSLLSDYHENSASLALSASW